MTTVTSCLYFFYTTSLSAPAAILSFALLIGVDMKGHSFTLLDPILHACSVLALCFGIFVFFFL